MKASYVPGTVLSILYILSHLILAANYEADAIMAPIPQVRRLKPRENI